MIEWLKSLPKTMFVAIVLAAGVLFIVLSDPPRTICDSQMKHFKELSKDFLFLDPAKPIKKETRYAKLLETCRSTNSPGGCLQLFGNLKSMLKDANTFSPECYGKLSSMGEFTGALWGSLDLMAKLAWGASGPKSAFEKTGWFDSADLNLYCSMKKVAIDVYGQSRWDSFIGEYLNSLPQAATLGRNEAWARMLFSVSCSAYL